MAVLIVAANAKDWPLEIPGVEVITPGAYLTDARYGALRGAKVFNLCRRYSYQSQGYYVSLLAAARGHKPLPSIQTIQDLRTGFPTRDAADDLDDLIQRSLRSIQSPHFTLSIYFGRNLALRHHDLAHEFFRRFPAPLLRAEFERDDKEGWSLKRLRPIPFSEAPPEHLPFIQQAALDFFASKRAPRTVRDRTRYDLAILIDEKEEDGDGPSNKKAIGKFLKAAEREGFYAETITREDFGRLSEFDALFIRATTAVNHYTWRFARRAEAEGLVVIDDPHSILCCCNKVFLAELLARHRIAAPRTVIINRENQDEAPGALGFPLILKQPDSAFSAGVKRVSDLAEYADKLALMLERSDLVIAQGFAPTEFDWRIGVLDRRPLYACKYFMSDGHWQIIDHKPNAADTQYGRVETLPVEEAPSKVVRAALRAANLIGDGLYGVDVKEINGRPFVIEVNDNPSIDAGYEDKVLGDELYHRVMRSLMNRVERRKGARR